MFTRRRRREGPGTSDQISGGVRWRGIRVGLFLFLPGLFLWLSGCGGNRPPAQLPDVRHGDFLSAAEYDTLSSSDKKHYCQLLENVLSEIEQETRLLAARCDSLEASGGSLRRKKEEIDQEIRSLGQQVRQLRTERKGDITYVVRKGDTLSRIADIFYGTTARWRGIYEANRDKIDDPVEELTPGITLTISAK